MQNSLFTAKNWKLLVISIILIIIGYVLLGQGPAENPLSKSVAPIILVIVYCILVPYAILAKEKSKETPKDQSKKQGV